MAVAHTSAKLRCIAEPEETVKAFHDRAVAVAEAAGVKIVIIGGLPQDD